MSDAINLDEGLLVTEEIEYTLLEDGEYDFTIAQCDHQLYDGSAKIDPCDMFVLRLDCSNGTQSGSVFARLYCVKKQLWKINQLMKSVGLVDANAETGSVQAPLGQLFKQLEGKTGRCAVSTRTYTGNDGKEHETNQVDRFLMPEGKDLGGSF